MTNLKLDDSSRLVRSVFRTPIRKLLSVDLWLDQTVNKHMYDIFKIEMRNLAHFHICCTHVWERSERQTLELFIFEIAAGESSYVTQPLWPITAQPGAFLEMGSAKQAQRKMAFVSPPSFLPCSLFKVIVFDAAFSRHTHTHTHNFQQAAFGLIACV